MGNFFFLDYEKSCDIAEYINELYSVSKYSNKRNFTSAVVRAFRHPDFDRAMLLDKMEKYKPTEQGTECIAYIEMLEKTYNKGLKDSNRIYFAHYK